MTRFPGLSLVVATACWSSVALSQSPSAMPPTAPAPVAAPAPTVPTPGDAARSAEPEVGVSDEEAARAGLVRGGLTADEAARRAIASSASLARVEATVRIAQAGSLQALSGLLPELVLQGRATYTNAIVNNLGQLSEEDRMAAEDGINLVSDFFAREIFRQIIIGQSSISFPYYRSQYELTASLTYPVTAALGTMLPMYRAAGMQVEAAEIQAEVERAQIGLRAREAFYEHVRARGALVAATAARESASAHAERLRAMVEAGVASRADLLSVEAQLASMEVAVQNATLGVEISTRALHLLMHDDGEGGAGSAPIEIGENVSLPPPAPQGSLAALEAQALDHRPELRSTRLARRAREAQVRAQAFARYPQLLLQGNVQYANPNNRYIPQTREFQSSWDLSAVLRWSPNDTLAAEGRRRQASAELSQLEAQEEELLDAVRLEVTQAYQQLATSRATVTSAAAAVAAADEAVRVREAQLEAGVAVTAELLDARAQLVRAQLELVDATIQMRLSAARLRRAVGEADVESP